MTTIELLMLAQTAILLATGIVVAFYTFETRKMRVVAAAQFEVMRQQLDLQFAEQKRAAEPIFVWDGGSSGADYTEWEFTNEGGPISHVMVTMRSGAPANISAEITPTDWLGTSRRGKITFHGDVSGALPFSIGFRTRLGGVGSFFFATSRDNKPVFTGSGWFE